MSFLSKLFSNSADDIARSLVSNYGDDAVRAVVSTATKQATKQASKKVVNELTKKTLGGGAGYKAGTLKKTLSNTVDDLYLANLPGLSKRTIAKGREMTLRGDPNTSWLKFLQDNGANSKAKIQALGDVGSEIFKLRDTGLARADGLGLGGKWDDILGGFKESYKSSVKGATTNATRKRVLEQYNNALSSIKNEIGTGKNLSFSKMREVVSDLKDRGFKFTQNAAMGNYKGAPDDEIIGKALTSVAERLDDMINLGSTGVMSGREIQDGLVKIGKQYKLSPKLIERWSKMNPEELTFSALKAEGAPFLFAKEMVRDLNAYTGNKAPQSIFEAMQQVKDKLAYPIARGFETGKAQKALKIGGAGVAGLGLLSMLGAGGGNAQDLRTLGESAPDGTVIPGTDGMTLSGAGGSALGSIFPAGMAGVSQQAPISLPTLPTGGEITIGGFTRDQLEDAYVQALMANDGGSAKAIDTLISHLDKKASLLEDKNGNSKKSDIEETKQEALKQLQIMFSRYSAAGSGQGVIKGNITNMLNSLTGGAFNPNADAYKSFGSAGMRRVLRALGEKGALSDKDVSAAEAMLPQTTDSNRVAQEKIRMLYEMLGDL